MINFLSYSVVQLLCFIYNTVQKLIAHPHHPGDKENKGAVVDGNDDDDGNQDDKDGNYKNSGDTNDYNVKHSWL